MSAMVTIALPSDLEDWAKDQVASGRAESIESLVAEALEVQRALSARHKDLVSKGLADIARGDVFDEAEIDAELDRWIAEDAARAR